MTGDWLFWCIAGLLVIYGLALQWWAVLANRDIHGRQCPRCWYDLSGTEGLRCPECGRTWRHESKLRRRPPRKKAFVFGVIMLIAAGFSGKTAKDGFMSVVPDTFITIMAPFSLGKQGSIEKEFLERVGRGQISRDDLVSVVERWIDTDNPPWSYEIVTRGGWTGGDPLHVAARFDYKDTGISWLDDWTYRLRLVPKLGDSSRELIIPSGDIDDPFAPVATELSSAQTGRDIYDEPDWPDDWKQFTAPVGTPAAGSYTIDFDAYVEIAQTQRRASSRGGRVRRITAGPYTTIAKEPVSVEVTVVAKPRQAMKRHPLPEGTSLADYLALTVESAWQQSRHGQAIALRRKMSDGFKPMDGVVVAVVTEVLFDDQVVATGELAWEESVTLESFLALVPLTWTEAPVVFHEVPHENHERWRVRVRANPAHAMRFFDTKECLDFEDPVEVPISW